MWVAGIIEMDEKLSGIKENNFYQLLSLWTTGPCLVICPSLWKHLIHDLIFWGDFFISLQRLLSLY